MLMEQTQPIINELNQSGNGVSNAKIKIQTHCKTDASPVARKTGNLMECVTNFKLNSTQVSPLDIATASDPRTTTFNDCALLHRGNCLKVTRPERAIIKRTPRRVSHLSKCFDFLHYPKGCSCTYTNEKPVPGTFSGHFTEWWRSFLQQSRRCARSLSRERPGGSSVEWFLPELSPRHVRRLARQAGGPFTCNCQLMV